MVHQQLSNFNIGLWVKSDFRAYITKIYDFQNIEIFNTQIFLYNIEALWLITR